MSDPKNKLGWVVSSGGFRFPSTAPTLDSAFAEFLEARTPTRLGAIVKFVPIGVRITDDNTYFASTEKLLRDRGQWRGPSIKPEDVS